MDKNKVVKMGDFIGVLTLIVLGFPQGIELHNDNVQMNINKEVLKNTPLSSLYIKIDNDLTQYELTSVSRDSTKVISGDYVFDMKKIKIETID